MNINDIRHNIYMSRWLGRTWQNYGCKVIPTIGWSLPNTYELCFNSVSFGSVVIISTIGCLENKEVFLSGFSEMKRRINPSLIIVYGEMIEGMTGKFLQYQYSDLFAKKHEQLRMKEFSPVFSIKEV